MASNNSDFKAPPVLNSAIPYSTWKRELAIWQAFTNIAKSKQAPAIFLTLSGEAREAAGEIQLDLLVCDDGVKNLLDTLDKMYLKDETIVAYEAFEKLKNL